MQIVMHVMVKASIRKSFRETVIADLDKFDYGLDVVSEKKWGRSHGWVKLKGSNGNCHGAINLQWDSHSRTLIVRAISRGGNQPDEIVGRFVSYLLHKRRKGVVAMTIRCN